MDTSFFREKYYLGRHFVNYDTVCGTIKIPKFLTRPRSLRELSFWKGRDIMNFLFYYSIPTIFKSLYGKFHDDNEYAFHFLTFVTACRLCYSKSVRSHCVEVQELFDYFLSRLEFIYDLNISTINMHLLLHLSKQVERFGALPNCSMFSFEHQFHSYNVLTHGTNSFISQISNKLTLLKYCKLYLEKVEYSEKDKILRQLSLEDGKNTNEFVFINRGHIRRRRFDIYGLCYSRLGDSTTTVVQVYMNGENVFVQICYFYRNSRKKFLPRLSC